MTETNQIYKPYGRRHKMIPLLCEGGLTKQSHAEECDINHILRNYHKTGVLNHVNKHQAQYGEITSIDLHEALNTTTKAQSMFEELPSKLRNKFKNDPAQFLDFVQDPKNNSEAADLGLVSRIPKINPPAKNEGSPESNAGSGGDAQASPKVEKKSST